MQHSCIVCGGSFEAKRASAKFCSPRCNKRHQRGARKKSAKKTAPVTELPKPREPRAGGVEDATRRQLDDADRLDTPLGQAALRLAARLDHGHMDTGSALASVAKQLTATLEAAVAGANVEADPIDELRAVRERKRNAG